jgi:NAD(P)-dependent dehydrogenase (short-subunit alcohol dehydrogenase family)
VADLPWLLLFLENAMDEKLIALVTGANKGLGKEVARQFGKRGLRVYLGSRNRARGGEAASDTS